MAEIIAGAAAVSAFASLVDLCVKLCKSLNEMRETFVDAGGAITALKEDVDALSSILGQLANTLEQSLVKGRKWSLPTQMNIRNIINSCSTSLLNLQKLLSKFRNFSDLEGRGRAVNIPVVKMKFRWVWEEKKVVKIHQSLATQKDTLAMQLLAIQVVHGDQLMETLEEVLQKVSIDTKAAVSDIPAATEDEVVAAIPALGPPGPQQINSESKHTLERIEAESKPMPGIILPPTRNIAGSGATQEAFPRPVSSKGWSNDVEDIQQQGIKDVVQLGCPETPPNVIDRQTESEGGLLLAHNSKAYSTVHHERQLTIKPQNSRSPSPSGKRKMKIPLVISVDALFSAVTAKNKKIVLQVLQSGVKITATAPDGTTPLQLAVALNHEEIVLTLLFFGADPNAGGGYEGSPLLAAIGRGHSRLVKILLEAGADPRSLPVLWKAACHSVEMVKLCIAKYPGFEYPIDINAFNVTDEYAVNGETPLTVACNLGKMDVVRFLLEEAAADAAVMFKGPCAPQFRSALHASIVRKDETLISLILAHLPDPNVCNSIQHGPGLLSCAIQTGKLSILQLLVDAGVKLDMNFPFEGTALQKACGANSLEMVHYLLQHHADANTVSVPAREDMSCPLYVAISHGSIPIVNELLAAGADPNLHRGSLWLAAGKGDIKMVKRFLEIETLDIDGFVCEAGFDAEIRGTALHNAALKGHADVLKLLLENGADPNVRTNFLGTALDVAIKNHHQSCVDVLMGDDGDNDEDVT